MDVKMERTENDELVYSFTGMNFDQQFFFKYCVTKEIAKTKENIGFYEECIEKHKDGNKEEMLMIGATRGNELRVWEIALRDDKKLLLQLEDMYKSLKGEM